MLLFKKCLNYCIKDKEKYEKILKSKTNPKKSVKEPPETNTQTIPKNKLADGKKPIEIEMVEMDQFEPMPDQRTKIKSVKFPPEVEVMNRFEKRLGIIQSISVVAKKITADQENAEKKIAELREKVDLISLRADKSLSVLREYDVLGCDKLSEKLNKLKEQALLDLRDAEVRIKECPKNKSKKGPAGGRTGATDSAKQAKGKVVKGKGSTTIKKKKDDDDSSEDDSSEEPSEKDDDYDLIRCNSCNTELINERERCGVGEIEEAGCIHCCKKCEICGECNFNIKMIEASDSKFVCCRECSITYEERLQAQAERARKEEEDRRVAKELERIKLEKEAEERRASEEEKKKKEEEAIAKEHERRRLADEQRKQEEDEKARRNAEIKAKAEANKIERERVPDETPRWFENFIGEPAIAREIYQQFRTNVAKGWKEVQTTRIYNIDQLIPVGFPNGNYCEDYSANGFLAHSRFIVNSSGGTVFFTKSNHMGTPALICLKLQGEVQKATSTVYESPKRSWGKKTV